MSLYKNVFTFLYKNFNNIIQKIIKYIDLSKFQKINTNAIYTFIENNENDFANPNSKNIM